MAGYGVEDRLGHGGQSGLMEDDIDAIAKRAHKRRIANIALPEIHSIEESAQVFHVSGDQVVNAATRLAVFAEPASDRRPDESGGPSHEICAHLYFPQR